VKNKRFSRVLGVALTLVLMLVAIPAIPVSAAISINVSPDEGEIDDEITVTGAGVPVSSELYVFFARQQADVGDAIDDEVTVYNFMPSVTTFFDGRILGYKFDIPDKLNNGLDPDEYENVFGGIYYIYITYTTTETIRAVASVRVIGDAAIIEFDPNEGVVGTEVEISGASFAPDETIVVEYDGEEIDIDSGDEEADGDGEFTLFIIIPESEFGEHTITVIGEDSLAEIEETFTVESEIRINPVSGEAGTVITVTGTGFDRRNGVDFSFGGTSVIGVFWLVESGGRTNSDGTFAVNITVPDVAPGSYVILAEDEDDDDIFDIATFTVVVNTAVNVSPATGIVGDARPSLGLVATLLPALTSLPAQRVFTQ